MSGESLFKQVGKAALSLLSLSSVESTLPPPTQVPVLSSIHNV